MYVLTEDIVTWDYDNHTFSLATEVSANAFKVCGIGVKGKKFELP